MSTMQHDICGDIQPARYRIPAGWQGPHVLACVWRGHEDRALWTLYRVESDELFAPGSIGIIGFRAIITHFGLVSAQSTYTPEKLQRTPPYKLVQEHWNLVRLGLIKEPLQLRSHDESYPVPAAFVQ